MPGFDGTGPEGRGPMGGGQGGRHAGAGGGRGLGGILHRHGRAGRAVGADLWPGAETAHIPVASGAPVHSDAVAPAPVASVKPFVAAVARPEDCTLCGVCMDSCPSQAIELRDAVVIDQQRCNACGVCVNICPDDVLEMAAR